MSRMKNYPSIIVKPFLCLFLIFLSFSIQAMPNFDSNEATIFIAVHPTAFFDHSLSSQEGLETVDLYTRQNGFKSYVLFDRSNSDKYFIRFDPTQIWVASSIGIHNIMPTRHVILTGGFFGSCYYRAFAHLLKNLKLQNQSQMQIIMPMDAIYYSENKNLHEQSKDLSDDQFLTLASDQLKLTDPLSMNTIGFNFNEVYAKILTNSGAETLTTNTQTKDLKIILRRNHRVLKEFGHGNIIVQLDFVHSSEIESLHE